MTRLARCVRRPIGIRRRSWARRAELEPQPRRSQRQQRDCDENNAERSDEARRTISNSLVSHVRLY